MNAKHAVVIVVTALALSACSKPKSEDQPAASATAPLTDEALDQAPVPVKEDFEEQARQSINEDNLDEQLSKLEKEIEADH